MILAKYLQSEFRIVVQSLVLFNDHVFLCLCICINTFLTELLVPKYNYKENGCKTPCMESCRVDGRGLCIFFVSPVNTYLLGRCKKL